MKHYKPIIIDSIPVLHNNTAGIGHLTQEYVDNISKQFYAFIHEHEHKYAKQDPKILEKFLKKESKTKEENVMAGTKGKKQKGTIIDRTVRRLDRMRAYPNMHKRVARWVADETTEVGKVKLESLRDKLQEASTLHASILEIFSALQIGKYVPPKKHLTGVIKLDPGKHVYFKPKYVPVYQKIYDQVILDDLFISEVAEKRVILSLGNPDHNPQAMKIAVPKSQLQANPPVEEAAA